MRSLLRLPPGTSFIPFRSSCSSFTLLNIIINLKVVEKRKINKQKNKNRLVVKEIAVKGFGYESILQQITYRNYIMSGQEKWRKSELYFRKMLSLKGPHLSAFETAHIMMLYFFTQGLSLLEKLTPQDKQRIQSYILSLEIPTGGFAPSSFYTQYQKPDNQYFISHIVFTYSAVSVLTITAGLNKINTELCLRSVAACQKENGAYSSFSNSQQADLRFVYAAVSVCSALNNFTFMNKDKVVSYINSCRNFDGGYGLRPNCQSHAGAIYCALASLKLLGVNPQHPKRTLHFLVCRQAVNLENQDLVGIQGRVGKMPDSCYSFWVGSSIHILTNRGLMNPKIQNFIMLCFKENQCSFSKYPTSTHGDPIHTLHSITGIKIGKGEVDKLWLERGINRLE